jgi:hypothetical protein
MRILHGTFHVHNTAPYASSPNGNNKLSAPSSVRIKTIADTTQTDNNIAKTVDLHSKTISDNRHTTPTTVAPTPLRVHPTNNSSDPIDLLYVQCQLRIPAHHPTVIHLIKTAANQTQQTSFATTVADLATIRETAPTLHATQLQIVAHLPALLRTMKTTLPVTSNTEPISSPILEKIHRQPFTIKPFVPHPLTQWMTSLTQSLGPTLHSLKWKSTNPYWIETFNLLPIMLHQILELQTTSLMIHNPHINALAHLILKTGSLIVAQQATTLPSSVISKMSNPAVYLSPLLMAVPNYLPTKAPQNVLLLLMMVSVPYLV